MDPVPTSDGADRYARLRAIPWWDQARLRDARVLVCGAGALGNAVLEGLALVGVGTIHVVDRDVVETSNLSRSPLFRSGDEGRPKAEVACRAIGRVDPGVRAIPCVGDVTRDVGLGLVEACDVVLGALDGRLGRLWINRAAWRTDRPWVDGAIEELRGTVKTFRPPGGPCLECGWSDRDYRLLEVERPCPGLPADPPGAGRVPTTPTAAAIVGGIQVQEALKLLHDRPAAVGRALVYEGSTCELRSVRLPRREDCLSHAPPAEPVGLPLGIDDPVIDLVRAGADHLGVPPGEVRLELDRDVVLARTCRVCERREPAEDPADASPGRCETCGEPLHLERAHRIGPGGLDPATVGDRPLRDLGIPPLEIVRLRTDGAELAGRLDGDRETVLDPPGAGPGRTERATPSPLASGGPDGPG